MSTGRLLPAVILGLAITAATMIILGPAAQLDASPSRPLVGDVPTPLVRFVAVSGSDVVNACQDPASPCRTLQHAVDSAGSGDLILVSQGTYTDVHSRGGITQVLHITKAVTVWGGYAPTNNFEGERHPAIYTTTLDAQGRGRVLVIDGGSATLDGLILSGGAGYYSGGGVRVVGGGRLTLSHSRVEGNSATGDGGGIFVNGGRAEITDNSVLGNVSNWGAGLRLINGAEIVVCGNEVRNNVAQASAGGIDVDCCRRATALIAQNVVLDNDGGSLGGGIRIHGSDAMLVNNFVARNRADIGSDVFLEGQPGYAVSTTLLHNTVVGRGQGGEGLRVEGNGSVVLVNNIVVSHAVGITNVLPASASVNADHTLFEGNDVDFGPDVAATSVLTGCPAFVDPDAGDYHITAGSAAVDAGVWAGVSIDIDDELRSLPPDLGADEFRALSIVARVYLPVVVR